MSANAKEPTLLLLSSSQAAAKLGVHPRTVSLWAREGKLRARLTPGGHRRFLASEVDALLRDERASA